MKNARQIPVRRNVLIERPRISVATPIEKAPRAEAPVATTIQIDITRPRMSSGRFACIEDCRLTPRWVLVKPSIAAAISVIFQIVELPNTATDKMPIVVMTNVGNAIVRAV